LTASPSSTRLPLGFDEVGEGVALGYVMNQLGPRWQKPRNRTLIDAVYQSLAGTVGTTFSSEVRTGNR
jgi:hypothetical protein